MNNEIDEFSFLDKDFIFHVDWTNQIETDFTSKLKNVWLVKKSQKLFRYDLNITQSAELTGEYGYFAQLNTDRAFNRRSPEDIRSVKQPFSANQFNFTKIKPEEIMFAFYKKDCLSESECYNIYYLKSVIESKSNFYVLLLSTISENALNYLLINVSPLERYHCLLIPSLHSCLPQVLTKEALYLGVSMVLLCGSPELRAGFNSLCGYATVNHLHLHTYYLNHQMKLETITVEHLNKNCYILKKYPAKGYVFQITSKVEIGIILSDIITLINYFIQEDIAHNLFITRGLSFEKSKHQDNTSTRDCVRIYVWPRKSSYGAKVLNEFNPAICELFGHMVVKTNEAFKSLTEDGVSEILQSITHQPFTDSKEHVYNLYSEQ